MFNIYIGKNNIPSELKFLYDPESVTLMIDLEHSNMSRDIVKSIDKGEVIGRNVFKDRFGIGMYSEALSTTSKILLLLEQTDLLINANELGDNGLHYLNRMCLGNVYFDNALRNIEPEVYPAAVNGVIVNTISEFYERLSEVQYE